MRCVIRSAFDYRVRVTFSDSVGKTVHHEKPPLATVNARDLDEALEFGRMMFGRYVVAIEG